MPESRVDPKERPVMIIGVSLELLAHDIDLEVESTVLSGPEPLVGVTHDCGGHDDIRVQHRLRVGRQDANLPSDRHALVNGWPRVVAGRSREAMTSAALALCSGILILGAGWRWGSL